MDDPQPRLNQHTYVRLTVTSLWENLPLVLAAAFVFSLLCAPAFLLFLLGLLFPALIAGVLLVPAAWAALLALEADIVRDVSTDIATMFRALPRFWARGVKLGLLACFPIVMALLTVPMVSRTQVPPVVWFGLAADGVVLFALVALYLYAFPLLVFYDLNVSTALHNALVLASHHLSNTLGLLSLGVLILFGAAYINSGVLFFLPAMWGLFVVNNTRMLVEEELVDKQEST